MLDESYFTYRLKGVVVHSGSADSGLYYSFIDSNNGEWFQFNDEDVLPFDPNRLPEQSFGSRENSHDYKVRNAYLLIY